MPMKPLNKRSKAKIGVNNPMYGKHHTEEMKLKLSKSNKGQIPWLKGRNHTEEAKSKLSENHKREKNPNWIGGVTKETNGYMLLKVPEGCKFSCMKERSGYIKMHRLIMAEYLQRPLDDKEVVHHRNEIRDDNRIENLELLKNTGRHTSLHNNRREMMKNDDATVLYCDGY